MTHTVCSLPAKSLGVTVKAASVPPSLRSSISMPASWARAVCVSAAFTDGTATSS
ncbi:hypothetical protein ACWGJB_28455 [Streptomyces sp. NPDC054813]